MKRTSGRNSSARRLFSFRKQVDDHCGCFFNAKLFTYLVVAALLFKAHAANASVDNVSGEFLPDSTAVVGSGEQPSEIRAVNSQSIYELPPNDEARLVKTLVERYHGYGLARPVSEVNKTLDVTLLFVINEFLGIEELTGTMRVTAVVTASWQDDLLRWNPAAFHQLKAIPMRTHDVFLPTIVKDGNGGTQSSIFMTGTGQNDRDINAMVWVHHTGKVEAKVTGPFVSSCNLNLDDFPFDSQTCRFVFKSWRFSDQRISLHQATGQKISEELKDSAEVNINANPNWVMDSITSQDTTLIGIGENFSAITYTVIANRRSDYYMWNVLMPSFAMAVLLLATFFMPFGPERSMFCITLVLTMNLFQQALTAKLPVTSEVIPYVRQTTVQVLMGIGITIESAFVWWVAKKDKRSAVPNWLRVIIPKLRVKIRTEKADALFKEKRRAINGRMRMNDGDAGELKSGLYAAEEGKSEGRMVASAGLSRASSMASRINQVDHLNMDDAAKAVDEFTAWGEWLEVAQICDIIMLTITMGAMFLLPIVFYRHRL